MRKEERRRKFHEDLLNVLYPPQSSPPRQGGDEEEPLNMSRDGLFADHIPDEFGESGSSSSTDDESECGPQTLTRAQRKRLRKKKLKETASCRRKIIGPLPPSATEDIGHSEIRSEPQGVRRNVDEESDIGNDKKPGEPAACANQIKQKHRRMAKKLARERSKS